MSPDASSLANEIESRRHSGYPRGDGNGASRLLLRLVDAGLIGVIFVAPLFMGGRGDVGRLVYVTLVCLTAVCWFARQCLPAVARWRWSGLEWVLLGGVLLVVLQLTPLPPRMLNALSPKVGALLPLWSPQAASETQLGVWNQLTLSPQAARGGLVTLVAHVLLFLVLVQRIKDVQDVKRLVRCLALAAIGMAVLGLAQMLFGNGKFLWVYEHPFRDTYGIVKGSFQNQNHFADFLALGVGPLLWWLHRLWSAAPQSSFGSPGRPLHGREIRKHALAIGLGLVAFAGLLTFSRGGVVALFAASVISLGILIRQGLLGKKSLAAIGGLIAVTAAALLVYGYQPLATRLSTLRDSRSLDELSAGRKALWTAHLKAIPQFAWIGTGVGSHPYIYPTYMEESFDVEFTHGENGYLHLMVETGILGLFLMLSAAATICFWCLRAARAGGEPRYHALAAALVPGLAVSLLHSCGDFVWYIPACFSLTVVSAACVCRLGQLTAGNGAERRHEPMRASRHRLRRWIANGGEIVLPRRAWLAASAGLFAVATAMIAGRLPQALAAGHWEAYFKLARAARHAGSGEDPSPLDAQADAMKAHLVETLRRDPYNARANLRMAAIYLREFDARQGLSENPMPLSQIRDAALASQFPTREAQDGWLAAVLGDNRRLLEAALLHARRAVRLCPLQGEGYVYLAELAFLNSASADLKHTLVDQALLVRPYSGLVLLAAGGEAALAGDNERSLTLWKQAFRLDPDQQAQIIEFLAPSMPAETFLEYFRPDRAALGKLFHFYRGRSLTEPAKLVGLRYVAELEREAQPADGSAAAALWDEAQEVHRFLGNTRQAVECARNAVFHSPDDFVRHQRLAAALLNNQEYADAVAQLQWCLSRRPREAGLQQQLELVNRQRLAAAAGVVR